MEDEETPTIDEFDRFEEQFDEDAGADAAADEITDEAEPEEAAPAKKPRKSRAKVAAVPDLPAEDEPGGIRSNGNPAPLPEVFEDRALLLDVKGMTFERWGSFGPTLARMTDASPFWLGDWMRLGDERWGEDIHQVIDVERFSDVALKTMTNARWVCEKIPPADRHAGLSYTHHRIAAELPGLPQIRKALKTAVREQMTTRELQVWVDEHKPETEKTAAERKKKTVHTWNLSYSLPVDDEQAGDQIHVLLQETLEKAFAEHRVSLEDSGVKISPSKS